MNVSVCILVFVCVPLSRKSGVAREKASLHPNQGSICATYPQRHSVPRGAQDTPGTSLSAPRGKLYHLPGPE